MDSNESCRVCGRKKGVSKEFGYKIGYYETTLKIGGRATVFQICSKCNRCFIKDNTHYPESAPWSNKEKIRVVTIQEKQDT